MQNIQSIVLIHGVWVSGWAMSRLAKKLRAYGYRTYIFSYPSVKKSMVENAEALAKFVDAIDAETLHFIAHSLGGTLLLNYFEGYDSRRYGRVVILGSPLNGSLKANRLLKWPFGNKSLGKSIEGGLLDGGLCCPAKHDVGVIAGDQPLGLGLFLGRFREPNDGTVAVSETRLPGISDHLVLHTSHTGMLLSNIVPVQIHGFLQQGKFRHSN